MVEEEEEEEEEEEKEAAYTFVANECSFYT